MRHWRNTTIILLFLLTIFILFEQADVSLFGTPESFMQTQRVTVALTAIGVLIIDLFLPVPSSLIMIAKGAIFGVLMRFD